MLYMLPILVFVVQKHDHNSVVALVAPFGVKLGCLQAILVLILVSSLLENRNFTHPFQANIPIDRDVLLLSLL